MKNNRKRQWIITVILFALVFCLLITGCGSKAHPSYKSVLKDIDIYFKTEGGLNKKEDPTLASWYRPGDSLSDWMIISELRQGADVDKEKYLRDITAYVAEAYKGENKLGRVKATEWHRITLAMLLAGGDPRHIPDGNGSTIDLFADGVYDWTQTEKLNTQGSNALIYALNVIRAGGYDIPKDAKYQEETIIDMLLEYQGENGAFGLNGSGEDVDITAMAVQALAPFASKYEKLRDAVDAAIEYLSRMQSPGGFYVFGDHYSSETCSQVIMALTAAGIDPRKDERFFKSGVSVADALMSFRNGDGGFASQLDRNGKPEKSDLLATRQAASAITSILLLEKGNGDYYNLTYTQ